MDVPFSQHLAYLERGALDAVATEKLRELVAAIMATGKKGTLTLKLEVSKDNNTDTVVRVCGAISTKVPEFDRANTYLFGTHDGGLLRNDPEQGRLPLGPIEVRSNPNTGVSEHG